MSYIVRIPEPCHEDWNKMTVDKKGRFCNVCSKSVVDFTGKTDAEIHSILIEKSKEKVCGRFNKNQVERPIETNHSTINSNLGFRKLFMAAAFLVFGTLLFSCKDDSGQLMGEPAINEIRKELPKEIKPLTLGEIQMDSIPELQLITVNPEYMIAGGLSYDYEPEVIIDSIPYVTIVDSADYVVRDFGVLGGAVYYENINEEIVPSIDSTSERKSNSVEQKQFNIFPNPSNGAFTIEYELLMQTAVEITVYDMTGSLVKQIVKLMKQQSGIYQMPINLTGLLSGIYICRIVKDGKEEHKEIVIAK